MSPVFFIGKDSPEKIGDVIRGLGTEDFAGKDVLIKVHMGERGNKWYVKPETVRIVTDELRRRGPTFPL